MLNSQNPIVTHTLLAIIAALLLVLVIQNERKGGGGAGVQSPILVPAQPGSSDYHLQNSTAMPAMGDLIQRALKAFPKGCEGKVTLADCDSAEAKAVKAELDAWQSENPSPRATFDRIIQKYGEKALTDEALQIRKQMRAKKP